MPKSPLGGNGLGSKLGGFGNKTSNKPAPDIGSITGSGLAKAGGSNSLPPLPPLPGSGSSQGSTPPQPQGQSGASTNQPGALPPLPPQALGSLPPLPKETKDDPDSIPPIPQQDDEVVRADTAPENPLEALEQANDKEYEQAKSLQGKNFDDLTDEEIALLDKHFPVELDPAVEKELEAMDAADAADAAKLRNPNDPNPDDISDKPMPTAAKVFGRLVPKGPRVDSDSVDIETDSSATLSSLPKNLVNDPSQDKVSPTGQVTPQQLPVNAAGPDTAGPDEID